MNRVASIEFSNIETTLGSIFSSTNEFTRSLLAVLLVGFIRVKYNTSNWLTLWTTSSLSELKIWMMLSNMYLKENLKLAEDSVI